MSKIYESFAGHAEFKARPLEFKPFFLIGCCGIDTKHATKEVAFSMLDGSKYTIEIDYDEAENARIKVLANSNYIEEEPEPQKKGLRIKKQYIRNNAKVKQERKKSLRSNSSEIIIKNKGKEHDSPGSTFSMSVVDVPPKKQYWKKFREMLLDIEFERMEGDALSKTAFEYHFRNQIEKDYPRLCIINDFQILFIEDSFYFTQNDDGLKSSPIPKEDIDIDIIATILTEIEEDPYSRYPLENLFRIFNKDYKAMVKCILTGEFRNVIILEECDKEKIANFREKVMGFRKYIEVKD